MPVFPWRRVDRRCPCAAKRVAQVRESLGPLWTWRGLQAPAPGRRRRRGRRAPRPGKLPSTSLFGRPWRLRGRPLLPVQRPRIECRECGRYPAGAALAPRHPPRQASPSLVRCPRRQRCRRVRRCGANLRRFPRPRPTTDSPGEPQVPQSLLGRLDEWQSREAVVHRCYAGPTRPRPLRCHRM